MLSTYSTSPAVGSDADRWESLQTAIESACIRSSFELLRENGIEPILIKGWAASVYYPSDKFRVTSDVDLAVSAVDFATADHVYHATPTKGLPVDLHRELRHLDTCSWSDLFSNSVLIDLAGTMVRVLRPEDHLRVLAVHWLTDGGWFRERLLDIYYSVKNRPTDFDWDRCLKSVSPLRRRWIVCVIGLTNKYFDLYIDDLPFAGEARDLPSWLVKAVEREWASGVRLLPLTRFLGSPQDFLKQVKKRLPPNPIHATVDMEGSFDARTRVHYQIGTILKRSVPLVKNLFVAARSSKINND